MQEPWQYAIVRVKAGKFPNDLLLLCKTDSFILSSPQEEEEEEERRTSGSSYIYVGVAMCA